MDENIIQLKIDMKEVKTDMQHIKKSHQDLTSVVKDGFEDIGKKIDCLDEKFSAKWVENIFIWAARVLGGLFLVGLAGLLVTAFIYFAK